MKSFKAIAAMSEYGRVIGNKGNIPWDLPEDFQWFKRATMGHILVMGRKTYESIGRPLKGRDTFVLSRTPKEISCAHCFTDLSILDRLKTDKTIWIAGGEDVYRQMLPRCDELYLTIVHKEVEGDACFPRFEDSFKLSEIILTSEDFTIELWKRN